MYGGMIMVGDFDDNRLHLNKGRMMAEQYPGYEELLAKLSSAVRARIPPSLDKVIKLQRRDYKLRLTTDEEIFNLHRMITPSTPKDIIDNWNLITLVRPQGKLVFLLGEVRRKNGCPRITSDIVSIDREFGFLTTISGSLYELGDPKNAPPTELELFLVCRTFHSWGFGDELGVPLYSINYH
ncbi:MAG: hypothetical protein BVN34_08615 [Proteobacteria bacterium ST_bin12]|nr:MAG: hypothetical protein BVN34_08615 [Proteobacteria bacterium ST_bin12]